LSRKIDEKFGCRIDAGYQQLVAGSDARGIKQVALGVIDLSGDGFVRTL
jgi:hypothetical protein